MAAAALRAIAVVSLALGGLCSCGVLAINANAPYSEQSLRNWLMPAEFLFAAAVLWIFAIWLNRRAKRAEVAGPLKSDARADD